MAGVREKKAQKTKAELISAARRLFAKKGYAATSTEEILEKTGLTRGALYHHFTDKAALFEAVCTQLHEEAVEAITSATAETDDPFEALLSGSYAWMDHMAKPEVNRILIIEAPAVLGWESWSALDKAHGFGSLMEGVAAAQAAGVIRPIPAEELSVLLNGAMNAAVLWAGYADGKKPLKRIRKALGELLSTLRVDKG